MTLEELFTVALGLGRQWRVAQCRFEGEPKRLELRLEHVPGEHFECPVCKDLCGTHDTIERRWRHMDFFQYRCELVKLSLPGSSTRGRHPRFKIFNAEAPGNPNRKRGNPGDNVESRRSPRLFFPFAVNYDTQNKKTGGTRSSSASHFAAAFFT